jgi:hypothetical protein
MTPKGVGANTSNCGSTGKKGYESTIASSNYKAQSSKKSITNKPINYGTMNTVNQTTEQLHGIDDEEDIRNMDISVTRGGDTIG